jgi:DNA-3-methyladenine glycosylase II
MPLQFSLPIPRDFSFRESLVFLNRSRDDVLHVVGADSVQKILKVESTPVFCEIVSAETELRITIHEVQRPAPLQERVSGFIRTWFDLDRDLTGFYAMAAADRVLRIPAQKYRGFRLIIIQDLFEALSWAIIGQQINLAFAYTLYRRFIEAFGESHIFDGRKYWVFPAPVTVAATTPEHLVALQMTRMKSRYLVGVARAIAAGGLSRAHLLAMEPQKAFEVLVGLKGVGPWTANYVMMRCLGCPTALPLEDVGLHLAIKHFLNMSGKPSIDQVRTLASGWSGWEAYATFYLYRAMIDLKK